jgi:hypothetical protein
MVGVEAEIPASLPPRGDGEAQSGRCFRFFSVVFFSLAHLARAALRALALRSSGLSLEALILPPLEPPSFPSATALGFFSRIASEPYMPVTMQKINKKTLDIA